MEWWVSPVVEASTGAGGGAAQPIIEFVLSWLFTIAGAGIIIGLVIKAVTLIGNEHREGITGFLVTFLFAVVLIGSSRQIASAVTGFAGGTPLVSDETGTLASAVLGYLLGDLLWGSSVLLACTAFGHWMGRQVRHGH